MARKRVGDGKGRHGGGLSSGWAANVLAGDAWGYAERAVGGISRERSAVRCVRKVASIA